MHQYKRRLDKSPAEIVFGFKINRTQWHEQDKQQDRIEIVETVLNKYKKKPISRIHERSYELKNKQGKSLVRNVEWLQNFKEGGC